MWWWVSVSENTANQSVEEQLQRVLLISSAWDMINSAQLIE